MQSARFDVMWLCDTQDLAGGKRDAGRREAQVERDTAGAAAVIRARLVTLDGFQLRTRPAL